MEPNALREPFERWLSGRRPDAARLRVGDFESPKSGFSAQTFFVPVRFRRGGIECAERVVLRVESPGPAIYPQQAPGLDIEVEIQYRAMEAVSRAAKVPLAPLIGFEPDPRILGAPFFAMEFVEGKVPVENPPYTQEGFFVEAAAHERRRMLEDGLRVLAELHTLDWRSAGLEWLVPPGITPGVEAQLDLWEGYTRRELRDRVHPALERAFAWLRANLPTDLEAGLSWGDSRPGNIIWRDFRCVCLTDWESVAIAPPEIDLGWWLMFDRSCHESVGVKRLPGEPTREEQRDCYAAYAGRDVGDTHYFEVFAAMRYSAVVVRVMNRAVDRGLLPPDQLIWLQNPAATCLADLLGMDPAEFVPKG